MAGCWDGDLLTVIHLKLCGGGRQNVSSGDALRIRWLRNVLLRAKRVQRKQFCFLSVGFSSSLNFLGSDFSFSMLLTLKR